MFKQEFYQKYVRPTLSDSALNQKEERTVQRDVHSEGTLQNQPQYIKWFKDLQLEDVPLVGGKNASLGELYRELTPLGTRGKRGLLSKKN